MINTRGVIEVGSDNCIVEEPSIFVKTPTIPMIKVIPFIFLQSLILNVHG